MEDKKDVFELIVKSNKWYKETKYDWRNQLSFRNKDDKTIIADYISNSNLFSKNCLEGIIENVKTNTEGVFGYFFFKSDEMFYLDGFCNNDSLRIKDEIDRINDSTYRYRTFIKNILDVIPVSELENDYPWIFERGEKGEEWQFFIIIIKENDKWVIDEIGKIMALPVRKEE